MNFLSSTTPLNILYGNYDYKQIPIVSILPSNPIYKPSTHYLFTTIFNKILTTHPTPICPISDVFTIREFDESIKYLRYLMPSAISTADSSFLLAISEKL